MTAVTQAQGRELVDPLELPLERVEAEICTLAGQIAAATCRFLQLLADFDARDGWAGWGVRSCAHWLSWRCGLDLRTGREYVRVARCMAELPRLREAFAQGRLSYSKVRAIARVATPDNEQDLVDAGLHAPAAQVERLVRGLQVAQRNCEGAGAGSGSAGTAAVGGRARMGVSWRWDDEGCLVIWGRMGPEEGARVLAGLARMEHQRHRDDAEPAAGGEGGDGSNADAAAGGGSAGPPTETDGSAEPLTDSDGSAEPPATGSSVAGRAPLDLGPALVAAAELACATTAMPVHAPAADVVVHVNAETLVETARQAKKPSAGSRQHGRSGHIDDGPGLTHSLVQMLACDGKVQLSVDGPDGRALDLGRRRRRPSQRQLAALWRRDRGCAAPGCDRTRFLHAHHVRAWAVGGTTDLDNLLLLCGQHHRALHDGAFTVSALGHQRFAFHGLGGAARPTAPAMRGEVGDLTAAHADIKPATIEPDWDGTPLDLHEAVSTYLTSWAVRACSTGGFEHHRSASN